MLLDRHTLAHFWILLRDMLWYAGRDLGETSILSVKMRTTIRRWFRMAEFALRRLIVLDALERLFAGEVPPPASPPAPPRNAPPVPSPHNRDYISVWSMRLIEPLAVLRSKRTGPPAPLHKPGPHDELAAMECQRLRLRLEAFNRLIARRGERATRLMAWFLSRGPQDHCTPWRWSRCPFVRHRDFGDPLRQIIALSDRAVQVQYIRTHDPPPVEDYT